MRKRKATEARTTGGYGEAEFRLAFEMARDAIFWADAATGRIINCNRAAERLLGAPRRTIIGKHQTWLHPPELRDEVRRLFADHIRAGRTAHHGETVALHRKGRRIPVHISAGTVRIGDRDIIQGVFQDITERRALEASAARQSELLRIQQELSLDGIVVVDDKGRILSHNRRFVEMWHIPQEALAARSWKEVLDWMIGDVADPDSILPSPADGDEPRSQDVILRDGRVFEHLRRPLKDGDSPAAGHISFFRDVSESRRTAQRRAYSERAKLQRAVIAQVAQEIRGPISRIRGWAEALRAGEADRSPRRERVLAIEGQCLHLEAALRRLLERP